MVNKAPNSISKSESKFKIAAEIFRACDIRGIVDVTLTEQSVFLIGKVLGIKALRNGESQILVGRDGRISGPRLLNTLISGLTSVGINVIDIGCVATPLLYFATHHLKIPSGVMLTGSHNPINYNGLKIILGGASIYGSAIQDIRIEIEKLEGNIQTHHVIPNVERELPKHIIGKVEQKDIIHEYTNYICNTVKVHKPLKVVVDCANGAASHIAPILYEKLGVEVIPLYCEVDGNFPNHHPDPGDPNNLVDLIKKVKETKADLGLAFDGDGDRLGLIDSNGKIIWPDRYLMLLAKDVLKRNKGAKIIFDVKCTKDLQTYINTNGGIAIIWKTGHSLIKAKIKETNALLAGEMSGHIFIQERWFGFDDGIYAGARLLELLSQYAENSATVFSTFPEKFSTPEIQIAVTEQNKVSIIKSLINTSNFTSLANFKQLITIDGLRVEFDNCWGLIRSSNTTPKLIARFEANDVATLEKIKKIFRTNLLAIEPTLELPF